MKEEQIKDISIRLFQTADIVCNEDNQRRTFFQGARQMMHALSMNDLIEVDDKLLIVAPINKEIDKIFKALIS